MDYKLNNLKDKIYKEFIRGKYGAPKIPTANEVLEKIESFTDASYTPITSKDRFAGMDYAGISGKFSNVIDDIDILFESIEDESKDVLDQLTHSLKEQNGVKRELRRIKSRANDIINRRLGEEYLEYNFTESFDDVERINAVYSDPIDTDAGVFTILSSSSNLLTLNHYRDKKLEFNIIEAFSKVEEYGYVGETNAAAILSKGDPKSITYKIRTARPTNLKAVLALQLLPDGKPTEINAVGISLDSGMSKGFIRLYYQKNFQWKDVPALSIQEVKGDNVVFSFPTLEATHIKFEFIKEFPDVPASNEYLITIYEIAISKSSNRRGAKIYSKPIIIEKYSTETPVVNNISCVTDADIPNGCSVKIYVAQDTPLSGQFINSNGTPVFSDSLEAVDFNPLATGFVYLSDMWARDGLSGLDPYKGFDFNWKELKPSQATGDAIPDTIEFNNTTKHSMLDGSLFSISNEYLFGDADYTGLWPQYPDIYGNIFISGWCNSTNSMWGPFLSGAVGSGFFVSGPDIAKALNINYGEIEDSSGNINSLILNNPLYSGQWLGYHTAYPFNYYVENRDTYLKFGDYSESINGWWRPVSAAVRANGISPDYGSGEYLNNDLYGLSLPDFYFNGIKFYKIYKFGYSQNVIDSSIRLYSYETRPVTSDNDTYDHNFVWAYRSNWSIESNTAINLKDITHAADPTFLNYVINLPALANAGEEYIIDGVSDVKLHNTAVTFEKGTDYLVIQDSNGRPTGISLAPLTSNYSHLSPSAVSFDIVYNIRIKNKFISTWTSYAIVSPNTFGEISVKNHKIYSSTKRIVDKIVVDDLDRNTSKEFKDSDGKINFQLDASDSSVDRHFKVTMFCASDEDSGFSAKIAPSSAAHFIPSTNRGTIEVSKGVKFVSKIESIKIVDLSTLLYDTPMSNDTRCALITEYNGEKYLISKTPSKDIFPGYFFDSIDGVYLTDSRVANKNRNHYIRRMKVDEDVVTFTTGSSNVNIYDPWFVVDTTWNDGSTIPEYPNTDMYQLYPNHSTWGYPINLDDSHEVLWSDQLTAGDFDLRTPNRADAMIGASGWRTWMTDFNLTQLTAYDETPSQFNRDLLNIRSESIANRGFLFYNTGENLPSFYSISYRSVKNIDESYSRFLYKIELESDGSKTVVPKVRSVRFRVNKVD